MTEVKNNEKPIGVKVEKLVSDDESIDNERKQELTFSYLNLRTAFSDI